VADGSLTQEGRVYDSMLCQFTALDAITDEEFVPVAKGATSSLSKAGRRRRERVASSSWVGTARRRSTFFLFLSFFLSLGVSVASNGAWRLWSFVRGAYK
jgi:hypothetical protein